MRRGPFVLALGLLAAACSRGPHLVLTAPPRAYDDTTHIPRPPLKNFSEIADMLETTVVEPAERFLNPARRVRRATHAREARNYDAWDDVVNSSWFQHRNGRSPMTPAQIRRGPNEDVGPSPSGPLTIVAPKRSGVTPGLRVRDATGDTYLLKFDPADSPELASAAEAIATKLVHAAGYNASLAYIYTFDPARLVVDPRARMRNPDGSERPMTMADVDAVLARAARLPDGRIRALASWWIPNPVGPFSWEGRRDDDPNDRIPHQHRRELRGFYVFAAWINHVDSRRGNTFDQFVGDSTGGYIRHIMQDVSSTLGSGSDRIQTPYDGAETLLDYPHIAARALSLGLYRVPWERLDTVRADSATGYFSVRNFDPGGWMPLRPNAAFEERTDRDGYWGAKIVASFSDEQLRAAVSAGEYSRPAAAQAIVGALIERRDATVRYWFVRVTPIEHPVVRCDGADVLLTFEDYGIRHAVAGAAETAYRGHLEHGSAGIGVSTLARAGEALRFEAALPRGGFAPDRDRDRIARITVRAERGGRAAPAATVYLLYEPEVRCYRVAGLAH
ncbi:MAG: hypothetical protein Q7J79_00280 [Gemmatimonadales bacterium]|nr:hypothetical protein [Gemmatimonadales bacterium]